MRPVFLRWLVVVAAGVSAVLVVAVLAPGAMGHGDLDQTLTGDPECSTLNFREGHGGTGALRQEFVPAQPGLVGADLCLQIYSAGAIMVQLNVRSGTAGGPGPILASGSATVEPGTGWVHIDLPAPLTVTPGQKMVLEVSGLVGAFWRGTCAQIRDVCPTVDPDLYPQGGTNEEGVGDFAFRTYGGPGGLAIKGQLGACLAVTNIAWTHANQTKQWSSFDPDVPDFLQGVTGFLAGGGYFVNVSANCTIASGDNNISLYTGWNLFGWQ